MGLTCAASCAGFPYVGGQSGLAAGGSGPCCKPGTKQTELGRHKVVENAVKIEDPKKDAEENDAFRAYEPKIMVDGDEMLEVDLPEKLDIIVLLDLVGKYLNLDYMYDEKRVLGDVSLKFQGPIKVKDLYPLLESVMKFKGFVMTRGGWVGT